MNVDKLVEHAILLVLPAAPHLIPEAWSVIMNAVKLAEVAQPLVLTELRLRIPAVAAAQPETNVAQKLVIILTKNVAQILALPDLPRLIVHPDIMLKKSAQRNVDHLVILA